MEMENIADMRNSPIDIFIMSIIENLWGTLGDGASSIWRQVGRRYFDVIVEENGEITNAEECEAAFNNYFIEKYHFAESVKVNETDRDVVMDVTGCMIRQLADHFENEGIPREFCPFANALLATKENAVDGVCALDKNELNDANSCRIHVSCL